MTIQNKNYAKVSILNYPVYFFADSAFNISFISPSYEKIFEKIKTKGKSVNELFFKSEDEYNKFTSILSSEGFISEYTAQSTSGTGNPIFINITAQKIYNSSNQLTGIEGHLKEVTREQLKKSKLSSDQKDISSLSKKQLLDLLGSISETGEDIIFVKDDLGKYIFINNNFSRLTQTPEVSIIGKKDEDIKTKANESLLSKLSEFDTSDKRKKNISIENRTGDKEVYIPYSQGFILDGTNRNFKIVVAKNISELSRADRAMSEINDSLTKIIHNRTKKLKQSLDNFEILFEKGDEFKFITLEDGEIIHSNEKAKALLKLNKDNKKPYKITDILQKEYAVKQPKILSEIKKYDSFTFESNLMLPGNDTIDVEVNAVQIIYENQKAFYAIARDITQRKKHQETLLKAILKTEEKERKRFAKELHDGLGALISAVKMYIDLITEGNAPKNKIPEILKNTKELIDEATIAAKEIANNIKPHMLTNFGLIKAMSDIIIQRTEHIGIKVRFSYDNFYLHPSPDVELLVYRLFSELLNNSLKYSKATEVRVGLRSNSQKLTLLFIDNGRGFDLHEKLRLNNKASGLRNMTARVENLNGKFSMFSTPGYGFLAKLKVNTGH